MIIRPAWARMKAENHPFYAACKTEALRDDTASPRYVSIGRWSALYYAMSGESEFARRSYNQYIKNYPPATAPLLKSNNLRELGVEHILLISMIKNQLTGPELDAIRGWHDKNIEQIFTVDGVRLGDSDQTLGTFFYIKAFDKLFGTSHSTRSMRNPYSPTVPIQFKELEDAVNMYCSVLAEGGIWCESSDYNQGTVFLLFNGAEVCGIENFPAVIKFRDECAKALPHTYSPGLKDTFEWGDEQSPHDPHWLSTESIFAYLGNYYPEVSQFEADLRAVWTTKLALKPFYSRYFFWIDPWAPKADWRNTPKFHVAKGQGQVLARTNWQNDASSMMAWYPQFSRGLVDHFYMWFGTFTENKAGKWTVDHPRGYNGDVLIANQVVIAGIGAAFEVGVLNATKFIDGKFAYMSGINAGVHDTPNRTPLETILHENKRSIFKFFDRDLTVIIDRIHVTPFTPAAITRLGTIQGPKVTANPLIQTLWHSQSVVPTVSGNVINGDSRVTPLYPCTITIKPDPANLILTETKQYAQVVPTSTEEFQILVTIIGNATTEIINTNGIHQLRITQAGMKDIIILSSSTPGPKLVTSTESNKWGGKYIVWDRAKVVPILKAHEINPDVSHIKDADIYIEKAAELTILSGGVVIPDPIPSPNRTQVLIDEIRARVTELEVINDKIVATGVIWGS